MLEIPAINNNDNIVELSKKIQDIIDANSTMIPTSILSR